MQAKELDWKYRLSEHSRKIHELMIFAALVIFPLFTFFDRELLPDQKFWPITTARLLITCVMAIWLIIQKIYKTNEFYLTFCSFLSLALFCVWDTLYSAPYAVSEHNISNCTVFLAASIFLAWDWMYSFIVSVITFVIYILVANYLDVSLKHAFINGGNAFLTVIVIHPFFVNFRYESLKREFSFKSILEETNSDLEKSKTETEQINFELSLAKEDLDHVNAELLRTNEYLDEQVKQRTLHLEQTMEELDRFLYSSFHDLKAPISSLKGLVGLLKEMPNEPVGLDYYNYLNDTIDKIEQYTSKLNIASFLINRIPVLEDINLNSFVDFFIEHNKHNQVDFSLNISTPFILRTDQRLLHIIFLNILENSFKYLHQDRVGQILISAYKMEDKAVLTIEDNGEGIRQEHLEHVFDMFFRGSSRSKGNGLGLYIVKKAVDKLKGKISIESEEGVYTKFILEFPSKEINTLS